MTFNRHVGNVCKAYYNHILALRHSRASMPEETAKMLACTIVDSRLDYGNALLTGMSEANFNKLQKI